MEVHVMVKEYVASEGLALSWQPGSRIEIKTIDGEIIIRANGAGLTSLASHLLTLAQSNVPPGEHLHLDDSNALEEGSCPLIIEKE
jgi:hypothetical protein